MITVFAPITSVCLRFSFCCCADYFSACFVHLYVVLLQTKLKLFYVCPHGDFFFFTTNTSVLASITDVSSVMEAIKEVFVAKILIAIDYLAARSNSSPGELSDPIFD